MNRFAVLLPVGPGENELARLADVIESLCFFERHRVGWIVLIDDGKRAKTWIDSFSIPPTCRVQSLPNPRNGRSDGSAGGLCCGVLAGLRWLTANAKPEFVVKLDTDSLVINGFAERISARFTADPSVGMLGSYKLEPTGKLRVSSSWNSSLETYLRPFAFRGRYLQVTMCGPAYRVRKMLRRALANGYQFGDHCQGGGYAIRWELMERMAQSGCFDKPLTWLRTGLGEDIMMGVISWAEGLPPADYNRENEVFGVTFAGLAFPPAVLIQRGYGIIHSIKDSAICDEGRIRTFFKQLRDPKKQNAGN